MSVIRHPGPPAANRCDWAWAEAETGTVDLGPGDDLLTALHDAVAGWDGASVDLRGLVMGPFAYVMPDHASDGRHAAWYSPTHHGTRARITEGTALLGTRDGAPWFHAHAVWEDAGTRMGHLRPGEVSVAEPATLTLWRWRGARLHLDQDAETEFPIYHLTGARRTGNALIVRIAPHEDLITSLGALRDSLNLPPMQIQGIGSLIGADFQDTPAMASPISEVLIRPGAYLDQAINLPLIAVDPAGDIHQGLLTRNGGPILVTFEVVLLTSPH